MSETPPGRRSSPVLATFPQLHDKWSVGDAWLHGVVLSAALLWCRVFLLWAGSLVVPSDRVGAYRSCSARPLRVGASSEEVESNSLVLEEKG